MLQQMLPKMLHSMLPGANRLLLLCSEFCSSRASALLSGLGTHPSARRPGDLRANCGHEAVKLDAIGAPHHDITFQVLQLETKKLNPMLTTSPQKVLEKAILYQCILLQRSSCVSQFILLLLEYSFHGSQLLECVIQLLSQ